MKTLNVDNHVSKSSIVATSREHLLDLIKIEIEQHGNTCDLNHIDTSMITDMSAVFSESQFNGDISNWNVSQVKNMGKMFIFSKFSGDVSRWKPFNLENCTAFMNETQENFPYWAKFNNNASIVTMLNNYDLNQKLNNKLIEKNVTKRCKI